jgi:hypothetical protein
VVEPAFLRVAIARALGSLMGIPKLERIVDKLAVLRERADHGMIAQKWQYFLLRSLTFDERPDRSEMKGRVRKGDLAGLLNRPGGMTAGEAQEA